MTKKKVAGGILRYVFLITLSLFILVPVLWMVSTAFKTEAETYSPILSGFQAQFPWNPLKSFLACIILGQ